MFFFRNILLFMFCLVTNIDRSIPQSGIINFSAVNDITLESVQLDSIYILNLSSNHDTTLIGRTEFDLDFLSAVNRNGTVTPASFVFSDNYPNSFEKQTRFHFEVSL